MLKNEGERGRRGEREIYKTARLQDRKTARLQDN